MLLRRLIARGYTYQQIKQYFIETARKITHTTNETTSTSSNNSIPSSTQVFHAEFHPHGIDNATIHSCFQETCFFAKEVYDDNNVRESVNTNTTHLGIERLLIARSRPKNIMDWLCPSALHMDEKCTVQTILRSLWRQCRRNQGRLTFFSEATYAGIMSQLALYVYGEDMVSVFSIFIPPPQKIFCLAPHATRGDPARQKTFLWQLRNPAVRR